METGLVDQDVHGSNRNKWRLALRKKNITHRGRADANDIHQIHDTPKKIKRNNF